MFNEFTTGNDIEQEKDTLGGARVLESGLYTLRIEHAFGDVSKSGAKSLNVRFVTEDGTKIDQQFFVSSSTAKGGKNFYEKNGKKFQLPGFALANNLCLLAAKKNLSEMVVEPKVLKLWDRDSSKELPTSKNCLVELFDKVIIAGVLKDTVDKNKDTGTVDASGNKIYAQTGETRDQNEIDKFFRERDGFTVAEILAKEPEAKFKDEWAKKFTGITRDKTTKGAKPVAGVPGTPATGAAAPANSLFND